MPAEFIHKVPVHDPDVPNVGYGTNAQVDVGAFENIPNYRGPGYNPSNERPDAHLNDGTDPLYRTNPDRLEKLAESVKFKSSISDDRWAMQSLAEGEKKVTVEVENRVPNAAIFHFNKESHTLGNLLVTRLNEQSYIEFAAYTIHHPMIPKMQVRVQTDGSMTPKEAVIKACETLIRDYDIFKTKFTREFEIAKAMKGGELKPRTAGGGRVLRTGAFGPPDDVSAAPGNFAQPPRGPPRD